MPKATKPDIKPKHVTTTFRIKPEQWEALRRAALERTLEAGKGKADASLIMREILDTWLAKSKR